MSTKKDAVRHLQLINDDWLGHADHLRHACRGILLHDGKILLIYEANNDKYIIPGGGYDRLDMAYLKDTWEPNVFEQDGTVITIPAYSSRMPGAVYMMWNEKTGTDISEDGLYERFSEPLGVLSGKLW